MTHLPIPYAALEPNLILNAIESLGFQCSGSLLALNSYENRVYQIGLEDSSPLIAKFYRPGRWSNAAIIEEHQFATELASYEIPVVPPMAVNDNQTLYEYGGFRFALFPRQGGRALDLGSLEQLAWIGRFIGRLHAIGACQSFQHRIKLTPQTYGYASYEFLVKNNFIPAEIKQSFSDIVEQLLNKIEQRFKQVGSIKYIRLHGDCHAGNILCNDQGLQIVDLDDCLMGPAIQDLWMLASGNTQQEIHAQLHYILAGYQEFHDFNYGEFHLIEALRSLRMIHYAAWLAKRWQDPAFPLNFPWFNTLSYWREQLENLRQQLALLEESMDMN